MRFILFLLLSIAFCAIYALIGGTRLLFAYPSYLMIALAGVLSIAIFRTGRSRPAFMALCSMSLLAGYVALRAWYSPYIYYARSDLYMTGACVLVYLITAFYLTESKERIRLLALFMVVAVGQVALGLYQFTTQDAFQFGFSRPEAVAHGIITRASGMFISPNHFAGYIEAVAMFALGFALWARSGMGERIVAGLVAVICYGGVAISISRGGILSSAFSLCVFVALSALMIRWMRRPHAVGKVVLIGVTMFGLGLSLIVVAAKSKTISDRASKIVAKDIRYANWAATMDQFREAPLLGTGAGTHLIYGRLYRRPELQSDPVHAHGDYLEMLAEYGIVGLALSGLFLVSHLGNGLFAIRRMALARQPEDPEQPAPSPLSNPLAVTTGALGVIAALMAHSVVDFNMHIPGNALLYAFAFGVLANPGGKPAVKLRSLSFSGMHRAAACALGVVMIVSIVPKIKGAWYTEKARTSLRDNKLKDAQDAARIATRTAPENPYAWLYLGEAYRWQALGSRFALFRDRMNEHASKAFHQGIQLAPEEVSLLTRMAQSLDALGRFDEAEAFYQKALQWDPNLGALHAYYAEHLSLMGKKEEAREAEERSRKLGGTSNAKVEYNLLREYLPE